MVESATTAKRRMRRIPEELRKRSAQSCDLCRKRRCRCVPAPNGQGCVACQGQKASCSYTLPRKTRFYGSLEDLSDRYKCLDAIVRGVFPHDATATAADLMRLGQRLGYDMPDVSSSTTSPETLDGLLKDHFRSGDGLPTAGKGKWSSAGSAPNSPTYAEDVRDKGVRNLKREDSAFDDEPLGLIQDTSGHNHYIGPSGSLQFLGQLRRLLISRESDVPLGHASQPASKFTKDDTAQALEVDRQQEDAPDSSHPAGFQAQHYQPGDLFPPESRDLPVAITFSSQPSDDVRDLIRQLPSPEECEPLLKSYWNNIHGDFPLFHRATFEEEYESFFVRLRQSSGFPSIDVPDCGWIGCLHMMLAMGSASVPSHDMDHRVLRRHCVNVTKNLLPQLVTKSTLSGVRGLLLLSFFLHSNNERNAAWNLVGTATRMSFALGLHRDDTGNSFRPSEREMRKRVFCTLYGFEQFLASSLGRPSGVNDLDVQVMPPSDGNNALDSMAMKLHEILSAARNPRVAMGSTSRAPFEAHQCSVEEVLQRLKTWKEELSSLQGLDIPAITEKHDGSPGPCESGMQLDELKTLLAWRDRDSLRATLLLHIQYHYIYILLTRPFLLRSVAAELNSKPHADDSRGCPRSPGWQTTNQGAQFSDTCVQHACQLARIFLLLHSFDIVHGMSGLDIYFAYSAAMILILRSLKRGEHHQLHDHRSKPQEEIESRTNTNTNGIGNDDPDEEALLVALRDLTSRLRNAVMRVPKCSTMKRFARVMATFEESAFKQEVPAASELRGTDSRHGVTGTDESPSQVTANPAGVVHGLMDASVISTPSPYADGLDHLMQHNATAPTMVRQMQGQEQDYTYRGLLPPHASAFAGLASGLGMVEGIPDLSPCMLELEGQGPDRPIYGWEDFESMLGNVCGYYRQI